MQKGYLFISNSNKPTPEKYNSLEQVGPSSFTGSSFWAANELGWSINMGINRKFPEKIKSTGYDIKFYDQHIYRNIFAIKDNWIAFKSLCKFLKENPQIEIIHCNTPIGGVIGRLVGKKFGKKVIYTAHGFHFYKGAPFFNRTILKWIEKWLAKYTDILITINQEDYEAVAKFTLKQNGKVYKVPGVGILIDDFKTNQGELSSLKQKFGYSPSTILCIAVGDLNDNKNFLTLINSFALIKDLDIGFIICGRGPKEDLFKVEIDRLGLKDKVKLLGFRSDVADLLKASDIFLMSSKREGLPRSTMEAMAAGLPCIVSDIRGNRDLIEDGKGGFLIDPTDSKTFAEAICCLYNNANLRKNMSKWNLNRIKDFNFDVVASKMKQIFSEL